MARLNWIEWTHKNSDKYIKARSTQLPALLVGFEPGMERATGDLPFCQLILGKVERATVEGHV